MWRKRLVGRWPKVGRAGGNSAMAGDGVLEQNERILAGALLAALGYMLFTFQDAAIKLLVASFSVWQILFFRSLTILACSLIFGGGTRLAILSARSPILKAMLLRTFVVVIAWLCYYNAARHLRLAELTTIYYAAPIVVIVMSIFILGESVPPSRWAAVLIGFLGVFIACDPVDLGLSLPVFLVLAAAFLWGLSVIIMRKIALAERTIIQLTVNNFFTMIAGGMALFFVWKTPDWRQFALMVGAGVVAGAAQFSLYEGMKRAPASTIAPFEYTALVWAFLLGYLIWGDIPRPEVMVGAALIVAAGLLAIAGQRFRRSPR